MHLTHHHGLGNDFLVALVHGVPSDASDLARSLCDRVSGIGADGLVFGTPWVGSAEGLNFTLVNSDGSHAEVSGNGLICFGQAVARATGATDLDLTVDTAAGRRRVVVVGGPDDTEVTATVDMGSAGQGPGIDRLVIDLGGPTSGRSGSVDMGNPHLVIEVDDVDAVDLGAVGPAVEAFFEPEGCNVHLVQVLDRATIRLRPWERGAGLTKACGSGACAAAHMAHSWGFVGDRVEVRMPGGSAVVELAETIRLTGPSVHIGEHEVGRG
ncbi:MAG: diaminopimelate epimerase [Actinobacteria bacterium]|nr:diaminopimelate epimerase [Actinomycetota bacterium]